MSDWYGYAAGVRDDAGEVWEGTSKCQPPEVEYEKRCRWCFRIFNHWRLWNDHEKKCATRFWGEGKR